MVSPLPFFKSFQDFPLATKINPKGLTHQNLYDLASACSYLFCFLNKIHADYFIFWYHLIMWYQPDHDYQAAANFFLSFFKYIRDFFPSQSPDLAAPSYNISWPGLYLAASVLD